ncbi:MAG: glycosyltransferase family 4 protein [Bergeyella zoohelcum]|nr:glycosyltransferase family 4 protein [Bergeyella zoohelcum]
MKKIKIGFLCTQPPTNKKVWSGTIYKMYEALIHQGFEIVWIPIQYTEKQNLLFDKIANIYYKIFNRGFNKNQFITKAIIGSRNISKIIKKENPDVLFAPTCATEIAFLKTKKPILYLNDATFHLLLNYYGAMSGFGFLSKKITTFIEKKALQKANTLVFSSDWASNDAHYFYGIEKVKIHTIKFGSNAEVPEQINLNKDYSGQIIFLFLAVDWERKGGETALKTIEILKNKGYNVSLKVVGCTPPRTSKAMEVIPFLNKNIPEEAQKIRDILNESHFLFLPTLADCTPISFCEAAGYGLAVITTNTGGIPSLIDEDLTGNMLPVSASAEDFAYLIETKYLNHLDKIPQISLNARKKYETELNWQIWGDKMKELIQNLIVS